MTCKIEYELLEFQYKFKLDWVPSWKGHGDDARKAQAEELKVNIRKECNVTDVDDFDMDEHYLGADKGTNKVKFELSMYNATAATECVLRGFVKAGGPSINTCTV